MTQLEAFSILSYFSSVEALYNPCPQVMNTQLLHVHPDAVPLHMAVSCIKKLNKYIYLI